MNLNDTYTLEGINRGDKYVFDLVFKTYYPGLCAYANQFVRSREVAEEITQDFFLHIWETHQKIRINTSLKSYLYRSIHNRCLNYLRDEYPSASKRIYLDQLKNQKELLILEFPDSVFDRAFSEQAESELEKAIESLPKQCKNVFYLNRHEKLSYPEIASRLNISLSTVKTQMSRAMKKLSEKMSKFL